MSIVDPATGDVRFNPNFGSSGAVCCIAYTGKGDTIGVGLSRGLVKVINTATGVHHDLRQLDWYEMVTLTEPHYKGNVARELRHTHVAELRHTHVAEASHR